MIYEKPYFYGNYNQPLPIQQVQTVKIHSNGLGKYGQKQYLY